MLDRLVRCLRHCRDEQRLAGNEAGLTKPFHFVRTRPDVLHDCGTAFAWGMEPICQGDVSKCVRGHRFPPEHLRPVDVGLDGMAPWRTPRFVDEDQIESADILAKLWQVLGMTLRCTW